MKRSTEYLNERKLIAFPFTDDATGISRGGSQGLPTALIVDALFTVPYSFPPQRLHLQGITSDGATLSLQFGDGAIPLLTIPVHPAQDPYWVYSRASAGGFTGQIVCDAEVARAALTDYLVPATFLDTLPLLESVQEVDDLQLKSITLYNMVNGGWVASAAITGDIQFKSGHNVSLDYGGITDLTHAINMTAVPGLGLGRWPCVPVSGEPPLNGATPLNGDVVIEADDCYQLVPVPDFPGVYQLQGRCQACCTCQDYADASANLAALMDRLRGVKITLDEARLAYQEGVTHFNDVLIPSYGNVTLTVTGTSSGRKGPPVSLGDAPQRLRGRYVAKITNKRGNPVTFNSWGATSGPQVWTIEDIMMTYHNGNPPNITRHLTALGQIPAEFQTIQRGATISIAVTLRKTFQQQSMYPSWAGAVTARTTEIGGDNAVDDLSAVWSCEQ